MARNPKPAQRRPAAAPRGVHSKIAAFEATLNATLESLPDKIGTAVTAALRDSGFATSIALQAALSRIDALEQKSKEDRSELQEWLRTLTPYVIGVAALAIYVTRGGS